MTLIECRQLAPTVGDLAGNQQLVLAAIDASDADVLILPELVTSGYVFRSREEVEACAVPADSEVLGAWGRALSGDRVLVAGFAERGADGRTYNSAAVVGGGAVLAVYRKVHLWDREKLYFEPGSHRPPVLDTAHGRIAVMICFDMEFPEWTRAAALAGADLLAIPTNWPLGSRPPGERPAEVLIGQAAARVNRMFIACCDRAGTERGQEWTQGSAIIDQDGWIAAGIGTEIVRAELDLSLAREKKLTDRVHLFDDRREDLY